MPKRLTPEEKAEKEKKKNQLRTEFKKRKKELSQLVVRDVEVLTMHEKIINASDALTLWKGNKTDVAIYLQNFINYNKESLSFLGIDYALSTTEIAVVLRASQLVGCAPLISPVTGKQCGNIIVKSEYQDDLDGIIPLIKGDIDLKYQKHLQLNKSPFVNPPIYLECIRFIEEFNQLDRKRWKKFSNLYEYQNTPSSSTDWGKYALRSFDPNHRLKYPNRINRLITDHPEWLELMYVLSIALEEVQSTSTPNSVRQIYLTSISKLKQTIPYQKIRPVRELKIHKNDPINIQNIKTIGNNILKNKSTVACAWAFNITKLYERYVQYIFGKIMLKLGGQLYSNNKYSITGERPIWSLNYLEPDIVLKYGNNDVVVDAKYKSHMMNLNSNTQTLRDSFRYDLHQVLAYSSLSESKDKKIIFCYPCSSIVHKVMNLSSPINNTLTKIYLLGIPVNKSYIEEIINYIYELLNKNSE